MKVGDRIGGLLLATGSAGLFGALVTDGLAVVGRHTGFAFHGSIELVQAFITLAAGSAIAFASLGAAHATVDLVFDRLPKWSQELAHRLTALLGFLFVVALIVGSAWISVEYWGAGERTELLHIEVRWFRLFWLACASIAAIAILMPFFTGRAAEHGKQGPVEDAVQKGDGL